MADVDLAHRQTRRVFVELLPEEIFKVTMLLKLDLTCCRAVTFVPEEISRLTALTHLHLDGCGQLAALPKAIGALTALRELHTSGCTSLTSLPDEICTLSQLQELNARQCTSLTSLPEGIGELRALEMLNVSGCSSMVSLPAGIGGLMSLTVLNLRRSAITALPLKLLQLEETLAAICVNPDDPLTSPPAHLVGFQEAFDFAHDWRKGRGGGYQVDGLPIPVALGTEKAFRYLRALESGAVRINQPTINLLGDGGGGKTTLLRALTLTRASRGAAIAEIRQKIQDWEPVQVQRWVLEVADGNAAVGAEFAVVRGADLLALPAVRLRAKCGDAADAGNRIVAAVALLNSKPAEPAAPTAWGHWWNWIEQFLETSDTTMAMDAHEIAVAGMDEPAGSKSRRVAHTAAAQALAATDPNPYAFLLALPHVQTEGIEVDPDGLDGWQLWDFAGQLEYYPAHQFFLASAQAVTVLVTDASRGRKECLARLRHWLGFLRSAVRGPDAAFGNGTDQHDPVQVLVVATHTDTPVFRRSHNRMDFLPLLIQQLAAEYEPKLAVHCEAFKTEYLKPDGGGLAALKRKLGELKDAAQKHMTAAPAALAAAYDALKATANKSSAVLPTQDAIAALAQGLRDGRGGRGDAAAAETAPAVSSTMTAEDAAAALEGFGLLMRLRDADLAVVDPVAWLSRVTAAFVRPDLAGGAARYASVKDAVPTITLAEVADVLRARKYPQCDPESVGQLVAVLVGLRLCFHGTGGADAGGVVVPALLPRAKLDEWPAELRACADPATPFPISARRYECARCGQDSLPATLMAEIQARLYAVFDVTMLLRLGCIAGRLCDGRVAVAVAVSSRWAIDVVVVCDDAELRQHALDVATLTVAATWQASFASVPLRKWVLLPAGAVTRGAAANGGAPPTTAARGWPSLPWSGPLQPVLCRTYLFPIDGPRPPGWPWTHHHKTGAISPTDWNAKKAAFLTNLVSNKPEVVQRLYDEATVAQLEHLLPTTTYGDLGLGASPLELLTDRAFVTESFDGPAATTTSGMSTTQGGAPAFAQQDAALDDVKNMNQELLGMIKVLSEKAQSVAGTPFAMMLLQSPPGQTPLGESLLREMEHAQGLQPQLVPALKTGFAISVSTGADLTRRIQAIDPKCSPILVICGHADREEIKCLAGESLPDETLAAQIAGIKPRCTIFNTCHGRDRAWSTASDMTAHPDQCVHVPAGTGIFFWEGEVHTEHCERFSMEALKTYVWIRQDRRVHFDEEFLKGVSSRLDYAPHLLHWDGAGWIEVRSPKPTGVVGGGGAANDTSGSGDDAPRGFKNYKGVFSTGKPGGGTEGEHVAYHFKRLFRESDDTPPEQMAAQLPAEAGTALVEGQYRCVASYTFKPQTLPSRAYYFECRPHGSTDVEYALFHAHYEALPGVDEPGQPTHVNLRRCWRVCKLRIDELRDPANTAVTDYPPPNGMKTEDKQLWVDWVAKFKTPSGAGTPADEHFRAYMEDWSGLDEQKNPTLAYFGPAAGVGGLPPGDGLWMELVGGGFPLTGGSAKNKCKMLPWDFSGPDPAPDFVDSTPTSVHVVPKNLMKVVPKNLMKVAIDAGKPKEGTAQHIKKVHAAAGYPILREPIAPRVVKDWQKAASAADKSAEEELQKNYRSLATQVNKDFSAKLQGTIPEGDMTEHVVDVAFDCAFGFDPSDLTKEHKFRFTGVHAIRRVDETVHPSIVTAQQLAPVLRHGEVSRRRQVADKLSDATTGLHRGISYRPDLSAV